MRFWPCSQATVVWNRTARAVKVSPGLTVYDSTRVARFGEAAATDVRGAAAARTSPSERARPEKRVPAHSFPRSPGLVQGSGRRSSPTGNAGFTREEILQGPPYPARRGRDSTIRGGVYLILSKKVMAQFPRFVAVGTEYRQLAPFGAVCRTIVTTGLREAAAFTRMGARSSTSGGTWCRSHSSSWNPRPRPGL